MIDTITDLVMNPASGEPVEVICDICHHPFLIPASMNLRSTPETRYYQMCPAHDQAAKMAFITQTRAEDDDATPA